MSHGACKAQGDRRTKQEAWIWHGKFGGQIETPNFPFTAHQPPCCVLAETLAGNTMSWVSSPRTFCFLLGAEEGKKPHLLQRPTRPSSRVDMKGVHVGHDTLRQGPPSHQPQSQGVCSPMHQESPPGNYSNHPLVLMSSFCQPCIFVRSFLRNSTGFVAPEFVDSFFSWTRSIPPPPAPPGTVGRVCTRGGWAGMH